jgi:hypothetical protein
MDGPAVTIYINTPNGTFKEFSKYYIYGEWLTGNEFKKYTKIDSLLNKTAQKRK